MSNGDKERLFAAACHVRKIAGKLHQQSDMSPGEFMMFHQVKRMQGDEGIQASELGRRLHVSRSGVSHLLNSLEEKGLIERITSKKDRRAVYVRMTECGDARYQQMNARMTDCVDRAMVRLGHEKVAQITVLLNEFADIMEEEMQAGVQKK